MRRNILIAALFFTVAAPAAAQQMTLSFHDGLVSLDATSVPVRQILNEWAKLGDTKVIGVERVSGAPLTLKLVDVPEAKALEVILRSVAGYMAAPRNTGTGASMYDRILVMATSTAPAPAASAAPAPGRQQPGNNGMAGTQRFVPQRPPQAAEDEENEEDDPNPPNPPVFTFPQQPGAIQQPGTFNAAPNSNAQPMIVNPQGNQPQGVTINPAVPGSYPPTVNVPFGSSTPGTINAPPPQPGQVRPPGRQQ